MAKNEKAKKVPAALVAAVVVIVAITAFVPTVYMPYKNKKPIMDSEHKEALDTIAYLDKSIENQAVIEAEIADLNAQWEKYRKDMFVEPSSTLKDLNSSIDKLGIHVVTFNNGKPKEDPSGTVTSEGNPLYQIPIDINCIASRDQILEFMDYIEKESIGAYFINTFTATPANEKQIASLLGTDVDSDTDTEGSDTSVDTDTSGSDTDTEKQEITGEILNVKMKIFLYYFNQDIEVAVASSDTDSSK